MMIVITICLTVLALAGIAARLARDITRDQAYSRLVLADKDRRIEIARAEAASATGDLAVAIRELRDVAQLLTPAPVLAGRSATIHLKDEQVLHGIVDGEYPDRIRLRDAFVITAQGKRAVPDGGGVSIPRAQEAWRQEHEATANGNGNWR